MANVITRRLLTRNLRKFIRPKNVCPLYSVENTLLLKAHPILKQYTALLGANSYNTSFKVFCYSTEPKRDETCPENPDEEPKKLSLFQRFKQMYKEYWYVLVPVHLVSSAGWFGGFYYLAKSGVDIPALLESMHVSESVIKHLRESKMGYIAVSYALYKIATPLRYTVTLGGTTISINYLKKWGYIKPIPSKERMIKMYQEKKENLIETMRETKEEIKHQTDTMLSKVEKLKQVKKEDTTNEFIKKQSEKLKDRNK